MAQVRKIKYDQVMQVISENKINERMDDIERKIKGTPIPDENIHKIYTDSQGNTNYEYTCPCCGAEAVFSDYSDPRTFTSICCQNKVYFTRSYLYTALMYGFKAVIDERDCEIFVTRNIYNYLFCFDLTNYRKYMWDGDDPCNRTLYGYNYGINSSHAYLYLEGDNFQSVQAAANTPVHLDRCGNLFKVIEEQIEEHKKANAVNKKPREPKSFMNIKAAYDLISLGCFHGESEVLEDYKENCDIFIYPIEIDKMGDDHTFEIYCPNCHRLHKLCASDPDIEITVGGYGNRELSGRIKKKCSCGHDLGIHKASSYGDRRKPYYYVDEDGGSIVISLWDIWTDKDKFDARKEGWCIISKDGLSCKAITKTEYSVRKKAMAYIEWYNKEYGTAITSDYIFNEYDDYALCTRLKTTGYSTVYHSWTSPTVTWVINRSETLRYSNIEVQNASVNMNLVPYIAAYLRNNVMEQVSKIVPGVAQNAISKILGYGNAQFEGENCTTIEDIFNLSKPNFRLFCKMNPIDGYDLELHALLRLISSNNEVATAEQIEYFTGSTVRSQHLAMLYSELPNIRTQEIINYLEHCRQYQCIRPQDAVVFWKDYVHNALLIGVDMTDKRARRPRSLKMEHDVLEYKTSLIRDMIRNEEFIKAVRRNDKYSYKGKLLSIRPPKDMQELFEEGRKLDHCVGSYGDRIIEGRSNIYFIRWNDKPEAPYFTLEVIGNMITQVYGYGDKPPMKSDKELNEFIHEWEKKTGFRGYRL